MNHGSGDATQIRNKTQADIAWYVVSVLQTINVSYPVQSVSIPFFDTSVVGSNFHFNKSTAYQRTGGRMQVRKHEKTLSTERACKYAACSDAGRKSVQISNRERSVSGNRLDQPHILWHKGIQGGVADEGTTPVAAAPAGEGEAHLLREREWDTHASMQVGATRVSGGAAASTSADL
jgi:hypothetical protein